MRYSGDWLFWAEMARQGKVVEVYEKLNRFRLHKSSTTKKAILSGDGIREDIRIVKLLENFFPTVGGLRSSVRHGSFYKEIKRLKANEKIKNGLYKELILVFGSSVKDYYVERLNKNFSKFLPWLITRDKDRL